MSTLDAESPSHPPEHLFYDGGCGVCHWAVGFVARHDPTGQRFRFAPLGGETFHNLVPEAARRNLPDSLVALTRDGALLLRSSGVVHILKRLGGAWYPLAVLLSWLPRRLRDFGYDRIAAIRHHLARRPDGACPLMPPTLRARFDP
jgi:predicted DCC family thiol-disulfide oxidoreductase YuxK